MILVWWTMGCGSDPASVAPDGPPVVVVSPVESRPLSTTFALRGELTAWQEVELRARTKAFVGERLVEVGAVVHEGDVLVKLSAPDLWAERSAAEAELQSAQARLDHLTAAAKTEGVVAPLELETLRAEVNARRAQVGALGSLARELTVEAPFDGIVTARGADVGALVGEASGPSLVRVTQVDPLRLVAAVPERFAATAVVGSAVPFQVVAYRDVTFDARVARTSGAIDPTTRTLRVELDVANADRRLMPGMFADLGWPVGGSGESLFVPQSAVVRSTEGVFVFVVREGQLARVPVEAGTTDGSSVEVFGAVQAGEPVVAHASEDRVAGEVVTLRPAE